MRFSQRQNIAGSKKFIQLESMDEDLKNSLWNAVFIFYLDDFVSSDRWSGGVRYSNKINMLNSFWLDFFKKPVDEMPDSWRICFDNIKKNFSSLSWYGVYDFLEFIVSSDQDVNKKDFCDYCNKILEDENSAYRFVGDFIVEISSKEEINEVEMALNIEDKYIGAKNHLKEAVRILADKQSSDFRNSIKESICAIESLAKIVAGDEKGTLGALLKKLEDNGFIHPALKAVYEKLYGYTSDASGIRHAMIDDSNVSKIEARYMLIVCSAFVNYVVEKNR